MRALPFLQLVLVSIAGRQPAFAEPVPPQITPSGEVVVYGGLPVDLMRPEGRTRWDLTAVVPEGGRPLLQGVEAAEGDLDASRWVLPERFADLLRPGARATLRLEEKTVEGADHLWIEVEAVGLGWVHLPSGPREVVLQRALVLRERAGTKGYVPDSVVHRWIDPRAGIVAEVSGPPTPDGRARARVTGVSLPQSAVASAATLKIHSNEIDEANFSSIAFGWDRDPDGSTSVPVSSVTTPSYTRIGDLIAANSWDFSVNTSGAELVATTTPVTAGETCNALRCGYPGTTGSGLGAVKLERRDRTTGPLAPDKSNSVRQRQDRASDVVLWLRSGSQHEGKQGSFGGSDGESRFCYLTDDDNDSTIRTRSDLPEWLLANLDAGGYYMQAGDSWQTKGACVGGSNPGAVCYKPSDCTGGGSCSSVFNCEQDLFNLFCGSPKPLQPTILYARGTGNGCVGHAGNQTFNVLKGGVVTLPSGHTFNSLLVRTIADFCVYSNSACSSFFKLQDVRTVVYLWQVPHIGTVARLQSAINAADENSFTTLDETDIKFGLFPPRTITATGSTGTTVSISWDPGLDTHRITGYKVYWDTDSGATTPYAFNSVSNPGQVSFAGTTATISGLTPGTIYYFTVTSRSTFTDPSTSVTTSYESLLYPTQVSGDPSFVYPVEVQRATTGGSCIPTNEATGLTVTNSGGPIQICWNPVSDPCLIGYKVLGADSPVSDAGFSTVADVGLTTCFTGSTSKKFFLVGARGTGGTGPWGAYGH